MATFISQTKVSYEFPHEIVYEKKFDTAIRDTFLHTFLQRYESETLTYHEKALMETKHVHCDPSSWNRGTGFMNVIMSMMMGPRALRWDQGLNDKSLRRIPECQSHILAIQLNHILANNSVLSKSSIVGAFRRYDKLNYLDYRVINLINLCHWLSITIDSANKLKRRKGPMEDEDYIAYLKNNNSYSCNAIQATFTFTNTLVHMRIGENEWIAPKSCVLMIHNKCADLISILLLAQYSEGTCLPRNMFDITIEFIQCLLDLQKEYKEDYYEIAKTLEGLGIAETLIQVEDWKNNEFLLATAKELEESTGFDYMSSNLRILFLQIDPHVKHELMCLSKVLGHPYVDMEAGARKLYERTTQVHEIDYIKILQCINHIKRNYIQNYIVKYHKWPPTTLVYGCPAYLQHAYVTGNDPFNIMHIQKYGGADTSDMVFVNIEKNERYHKLDNIIPYLKDKTITLMRSKVMRMYLSNQQDPPHASWEETRLLLAYLLNPSLVHDHKQYIEDYNNSDDLSDLLDYLVIRVVPKEKELKVKFRGFGCKTYEERMNSLAQEKTSKRFLENYSDEQAMTLGELPLLRKLDSFRKLYKSYRGHKILYIVIDAEAWNNKFRRETVDIPMQHTLDPLHGTSTHGKTHLNYQKTLFYVPNNPTSYYWEGQGGGIEGLNQDTWVIVYIAQIKTALDDMGIPYHILCKGDDLRIAAAIPPTVHKVRAMSEIKNDIVSRISTTMRAFGHTIKIMESYGSSKYFAFSKAASIESIELPQGFRKIQKCYGASNALLATVDEYIASTFSNAHSACKVEPIVTPSYNVATFWSFFYLVQHPMYRELTTDELVGLMLVPSMLGGFPIIYYHNMHVRAESDLLAPFLSLLNYCEKSHRGVYECMVRFMYGRRADSPRDYVMIYKDPYAIPIDRPTLPSARLRSYIRPILCRYTRNEDIQELLGDDVKEKNDALLNLLASCNELNAKVLSALYSATPEGLLDELIKKFESARSINELMIRTRGMRKSTEALRSVIRCERNLHIWRMKRIRDHQNMTLIPLIQFKDSCPAQYATRIRNFLWKKPVTGITMPPLQHQIWFKPALTRPEDTWDNENHFTFTFGGPVTSFSHKSSCIQYTTGPYKPFLGYSTHAGTLEPTVQFIDKDPILKKIKNLIDITAWTNISMLDEDGNEISSNCYEVIEIILKSFTDVKMTSLAPFSCRKKSGTIQHHVRAPSYRESIVPNVLSNLYSLFKGESNSHYRLRKSTEHYKINFLHVYCYSIWVLGLEAEFNRNITIARTNWAVTSPCEYCNTPIVERPLVFDLRYGKGISLHPLSISQLGAASEEILRESLRSASLKRAPITIHQNLNEEFPYELAVKGVLQEIHDHTHKTRNAILERYNAQPVDDEGIAVLSNMVVHSTHRDIGQTEMKRIPIDLLCRFTIGLVFHYLQMRDHSRLTNADNAYINITPGDRLPWYGLIDAVHRAGRLQHMIGYLTRVCGIANAACYYNPGSASKHIGRLTTNAWNLVRQDNTLLYISYYAPIHLRSRIQQSVLIFLATKFRTDILAFLDKKRELTPYERLSGDEKQIVRQGIWILVYIQNLDQLVEEINVEELDNEIVCTDFSLLTIEDLISFFDRHNKGIGFVVRSLIGALTAKNYALPKELLDDTEPWEESLEILIDMTTNLTLRVVLVDLATCIHTVRSREDQESVSGDERTNVYENIVRRQRPFDPDDNVPAPKESKYICVFPHRGYIRPLNIELDQDYPSDRFYFPLDLGGVRRVWGASAGSETTLIEILDVIPSFNVMDTMGESKACACLADGQGGFTEVLARSYQESIIVYHSLPEDNCSIVLPAVSTTESVNTTTIYSQHLEEEYYDLSTDGFYSRLNQYQLHYDLVTCDLELNEETSSQIYTILPRLITWYLENRSGRAIFICKMRLDTISLISHYIDVLRYYCPYAFLMNPVSTKHSRYAYLVSYGISSPFHIDNFRPLLEHINGIPSTSTVNILRMFTKRVAARVGKYWSQTSQGMNIIPYGPLSQHKRYAEILGLQMRFPSVIASELYIIYTITDDPVSGDQISWVDAMERLSTALTHRDIWHALQLNFDKMVSSLKRELKPNRRTFTYEMYRDDRAAHREYVICKLAFLEGFHHVLLGFQGIDNPTWILSLPRLDEHFRQWVGRLDRRDRRDPEGRITCLAGDWIYQERTIRYPTNFIRGANLGLTLVGIISVIQRQNRAKRQYMEEV